MNKQLTNDEVNSFEDKCRQVEALLEEIGRGICSAESGGRSWDAVNSALAYIQQAIHNLYEMRP